MQFVCSVAVEEGVAVAVDAAVADVAEDVVPASAVMVFASASASEAASSVVAAVVAVIVHVWARSE